MKKTALLTLLFITTLQLFGAKAPKSARYHLLMDRNWRFFLGDDKNASGMGYDDRSWRLLDLPHDWSIEGDFSKNAPTGGGGGYLPTGIGWYRKTFRLPAAAKGKMVGIQFDGVYMNSEVWINGHYLGKRPNGYISFVYDMTPWLQKGENVIAVRVDNSEQPNSRWYSGSGIYRHVWLDITSPLHIATWGTYITTPEATGKEATADVKTTIENHGKMPAKGVLLSAVFDEDGKQVASGRQAFSISPDSSGIVHQDIRIESPYFWSVVPPAGPYNYTLRSSILVDGKVTDEYKSTFGVRNIEFSATKGFLLNGGHVKINGVCLHDDGGVAGAAVPIGLWKLRLHLLKDMGCNAIRTSHNPVAPEFLDLCDKMGFLVMDEAFDAWETKKVANDYHLYFDEWWKRDVTDQIIRDRNHPCVVLWSAGNEIPDQTKEKGVELLKNLLAVYHQEDPTRPVTTANDDIAADNGQTLLPFMNEEDIVGYNYANRWHERRELYYSIDHQDHPEWKMIGTESGAFRNVPEYSLGKDPAKARANYTSGMIEAEQLWEFVATHDYVLGDFMWTGIDYLGESRWPSRSSYSGQIGTDDLPKDGYYFYQSQWTSKPMVHLAPHWNWPGREGQIIPVVAYTNCDTVELFVNGKSYGIKVQEFPHQGHAGAWNKYAKPYVGVTTADLHLSWDVAYQPGVVKAIGHKNGKLVIDSIQTAGKVAHMSGFSNAEVYADGNDVIAFHIDLTDSLKHWVPTADNLVTFTVSGNGKLIGVDNGNPRDTTSFRGNSRRAFNGHVCALIQTSRTPGPIYINVKCEGLKDDWQHQIQTEENSYEPNERVMEFEDLK